MVTDVSRPRRALTLAAGAATLAGPWITTARAADYPGGPLRIVIALPGGGFNDTLGRPVAKQLSAAWKVSAVVDNKPGAGTVIGTQAVVTPRPMARRCLSSSSRSPRTLALQAALRQRARVRPGDPGRALADGAGHPCGQPIAAPPM